MRSVVFEFQAKLSRSGSPDERARHSSGAHDDSALDSARCSGVRETLNRYVRTVGSSWRCDETDIKWRANWQIALSAVVFELLIPLPECATSLYRIRLSDGQPGPTGEAGWTSVPLSPNPCGSGINWSSSIAGASVRPTCVPRIGSSPAGAPCSCAQHVLFVRRHRSEAFHSAASPQCAAPTKVPHVVFA